MSVAPNVQYMFLQPQAGSKPIRAIVMPRAELERIKSHSQWLERQARDGAQRQAQMEQIKNASKNLVKNWKNTVVNKQRERIERRLKRIKDEDDKKNAVYQTSLKEAAEERKQKIEDARRMILFERDDINQVNSAFVFSEVLHERSKQVEFNKHLLEIEERGKQATAEQIKRDVKTYQEEEEKRKEKEHEAKMARKAEFIRMMKEKAEQEALLLAGEKEHEKQDLADMEKEIKQVQENIEKEIRRKKEHVKKDALESIEMMKEKERNQKQEEEDEEKVIQIYLRVKERMENLRQEREIEARKAKHEHQERIRNVIAESLKEKEDDIDGMIAKALKEREEKEAEIIRKRKEYEEKLLKERKVYKTEVEQQKKREQILEKELKQWILMQRLRRDEIDKLHDMKKKESKWATKMTVREGYNKQLVEQREIKGKQDQEELERYHNLIKQIDSEDGDFFAYAKEVLEECKAAGRPVYPIQRIIHEYRKKHGIIHREKYQKWAQQKAEQEEQERREEELYIQQMAALEEATEMCKPMLPPLLKRC